jgi:hypothetical protein
VEQARFLPAADKQIQMLELVETTTLDSVCSRIDSMDFIMAGERAERKS